MAPGEATQFTDRPPTAVVRHSQPSSAIMAAAEDRDVDLIVLGRRGSGGFPSLPIGTTTHHVAAASGRPIAVVPSEVTATSDRLVERVVVGLDGLRGSAEAAAWSAQQWPDARFTAVHVVELAPVLTQLDDDGAGAEFHERAFRALSRSYATSGAGRYARQALRSMFRSKRVAPLRCSST